MSPNKYILFLVYIFQIIIFIFLIIIDKIETAKCIAISAGLKTNV